MPTPKQRYLIDLNRKGFIKDASQARAVKALEGLYERLLVRHGQRPAGLLRRLTKLFVKSPLQPETGLYFWGGVGRGKTYLMDNFYESLPFERKIRVHFHRFMRRVHRDLRLLDGQVNPLQKVADKIADETYIICFDEFFVSDIGDAMILGVLLEALFARGVCLVATSNIIPNDLYRNGLQRERFLPAIALLNKHCEVINVDGGADHRLRALEQADLYHWPLDEISRQAISDTFDRLVPVGGETKSAVDLDVEGRAIAVIKLGEDIVWFEFSAICEGPRSQNDYIDIAREFHGVMISNIPSLGGTNEDAARRFINLVDEFYDRNVKLAITASEPLKTLYSGGRLEFEFERTKSRILEMQSHEYLARPHRP